MSGDVESSERSPGEPLAGSSGTSSRSVRNLLLWGARWGVAIGLLVFAFRLALPEGGDAGSVVDAVLGAWQTGPAVAVAWVLVAATALGLGYVVGAWRFLLLLRGGGLPARFGVLLRAYVVAGFFNMVLPGAILGDVYRVWDVREDTGRGAEALGLVVLERLLSLGALGAIGVMALPMIPLGEDHGRLGGALVALCACFLLGSAAVLASPTNRLLRRAVRPLGRISSGLAQAADDALEAVALLARRPALLASAFALSFITQVLPVLATFALAAPLDTNVGSQWYAVIVPFVTLVALLPVSIGGAGLRESLYVGLFGAVGMRSEVALSLSLSVFAVSMAWAAVGGVIFLIGRRSAGAR